MSRLHAPIFFAAIVLVAGTFSLFSACGDQCNRESDCASKEVCNAGVCEPVSASYVKCAGNSDCDPNGAFVCRAGRCTLKGTTPVPVVDSGVPPTDSGIADTGVVPPDSGMVADMGVPAEAGVPDTGTSTITDAGTSTITDAGTSTVADAG